MNKKEQINIEPGQSGSRLDAFLAKKVPAVSRSLWKTLIQDGRVMVNGGSCKPNVRLRSGDSVTWSLPEEKPASSSAEDIPLEILYEDEAVLVLNKSPGMVVHPAAGNENGTLLNALLFHDPVFSAIERAGIVHRLDKETSGVMVVAKSEYAMNELKRQFQARETGKEYLALVWGNPGKEGRIESLIGRHPVHRRKMAVLEEEGRIAISHYETLEHFGEVSLIRVRIETGRTHQIRVHMAHRRHPVVGDSLYGRARRHTLPERPQRQMLHALRLSFNHPGSGKRLSFEAPLFDDMQQLLNGLRMQHGGNHIPEHD